LSSHRSRFARCIYKTFYCEIVADGVTFRSAGIVDAAELLSNLEEAIVKAKEEVASRKDIMVLLEKWMSACEEEGWLEDYNKVRGSFFVVFL
jgi:hypothetical protein